MDGPKTLRTSQHFADESDGRFLESTALQIKMDQVWVVLDELEETFHCLQIFVPQWYLRDSFLDFLLSQIPSVLH